MLKKWTRHIAVALLSLGFVSTAMADRFQEILTAGVIRIGVPVDVPPFGTQNANREAEGYDIDVANMVAKALGVSLGGVNYCLRALAAKGLVKMSSFQASENKLAYAYLLTPQGMTEKIALTGRFLKRKQEEYAALKAEIEALQKAVAENAESGQ